MAGMHYEEFEIGATIVHSVRRTVTESDNVFFSTLTMNPQPLHLDEEFARTTFYGRRIVNSFFTLALVNGLTVADTTAGTTLGNLGLENVRFPAPVHHGDTLRAETTVVSKRLSESRAEAGIVTFRHTGLNQHETIVCVCTRVGLMMRRDGVPS